MIPPRLSFMITRLFEKPYRTSGDTRASSIDPVVGVGSNTPELVHQRAGTCIENPDPLYTIALLCTASSCVPGRIEHELRMSVKIRRDNFIIKNLFTDKSKMDQ